MKTSFAHITVSPSLNAIQLALQESEEMMCIRNEITAETIGMLVEYVAVLGKVVFFAEDNDGREEGTRFPSTDASLRHALAVALKVTRAARKADHGQWAIRKLKSERLTSL